MIPIRVSPEPSKSDEKMFTIDWIRSWRTALALKNTLSIPTLNEKSCGIVENLESMTQM